MPGRGTGERLAVDPANSDIVYFGARSGNGLWKSTDGGTTFSNVTSFKNTGTYRQDPSDSSGYQSDIMGLLFVTFDSTSATTGGATSRIFVGVADNVTASVYESTDAGSTWSPLAGQPGAFFPHKCKLQPTEKAIYLTYSNGIGPYDGTGGAVWKYDLTHQHVDRYYSSKRFRPILRFWRSRRRYAEAGASRGCRLKFMVAQCPDLPVK